jgi:hypothetical protein
MNNLERLCLKNYFPVYMRVSIVKIHDGEE